MKLISSIILLVNFILSDVGEVYGWSGIKQQSYSRMYHSKRICIF